MHVARDANDTRVQIAYLPLSASSTRVVVSTGAFGDSDLRDRVWDAVRIRLGLIAIAPANASPTATNAPATNAPATNGPATTQPTAAATTQPAGSTPAASAGN